MITTPKFQIDFARVPADLQELDQWVLWKAITRDGKDTKMPWSVYDKAASTTDPTTWTSFDNAVSHYDESQHSGIGFVFTSTDPFCGIDLDGCRDPETGTVADWAVDEVIRFASYTEISPSQTGLKIWITADSQLSNGRKKELRVPEIVAKSPAVEVYSQRRFFAVTGNVYKQYRHVEKRESALLEFLSKHWPDAPSVNAQQHDWHSDDAVVERARKYVAKMPGAVSGENGHGQTFKVACRLVKGFVLTHDQAFDVLKEWNATCEPKWTDHELQHKIDSASNASGASGYLRVANPERWPSITVPDHKPQKTFSRSANADECTLKHGAKRAIVDNADAFKPFPISELPSVLATFCREVSAAVGCDESFPAMVALAVCSAAIGTSRQLCIKYGWFVPPIIWTILVGESGTQKSPPFRLAMDPLKERQRRDADSFIADISRYQSDLRAYKRAIKAWEKKCEGDEPEQPKQPVRRRCIVQDSTIEALAPILSENPRGVLLGRDELSGWLASFDKYSNKAATSSEVPKWLEIYNTESITIDRKTGDFRFVFIRRPSVSICGGIQPGILARCLTAEHKDSGLQSRLLMTFPPRHPKQWRDDEVSPATQAAYGDAVRALFELKGDDSSGELKPATLKLSPEARALFKSYVNRTGDEQAAMSGHVASQWSKLEEIPARLAIILHCVRQVTTGVADHWEVDESTMQSAIALGEWFKDETLRIGRMLVEPEDERDAKELAKWIQSRGGRITARDLCRMRRDIISTERAESMLIQLVEFGFGTWHDIHKSREFVLHEPALSTNGA